jgi:hypothetical protein
VVVHILIWDKRKSQINECSDQGESRDKFIWVYWIVAWSSRFFTCVESPSKTPTWLLACKVLMKVIQVKFICFHTAIQVKFSPLMYILFKPTTRKNQPRIWKARGNYLIRASFIWHNNPALICSLDVIICSWFHTTISFKDLEIRELQVIWDDLRTNR